MLIDLQMPEMNGLDLQAALARTRKAMPVIFLTGRGDIPSTVRAMREGAEDFLEKRAPKEKLLEAVRRAIARDARERATRARTREVQARFDKLSDREREVLENVLRGALNKQIADDLGICERTVKLHRTSITRKLGVQSVAELARLARKPAPSLKGSSRRGSRELASRDDDRQSIPIGGINHRLGGASGQSVLKANTSRSRRFLVKPRQRLRRRKV